MAEAWKTQSDGAYKTSYVETSNATHPDQRERETTAMILRVNWFDIHASSRESTNDTSVENILKRHLDTEIRQFEQNHKGPQLKDPEDAFETAFTAAWRRMGADSSPSALSAARAAVQVDTHTPLPPRRQHAAPHPR